MERAVAPPPALPSSLLRDVSALSIGGSGSFAAGRLAENFAGLALGSPRRLRPSARSTACEDRFVEALRRWRRTELRALKDKAREALRGGEPPSPAEVGRAVAARAVLFEVAKLQSGKVRRWLAARPLLDNYGFGADWLAPAACALWAALLAQVDEATLREEIRTLRVGERLLRRLLPIALHATRRLLEAAREATRTGGLCRKD